MLKYFVFIIEFLKNQYCGTRLITFDLQLGNTGAGFGEDVVQLPYLTDKETEVQMG